MTRETEKLRLVTEFSSLRQGDLVVVKCDHCGRSHREMLLRWESRRAIAFLPGGEVVNAMAGWNLGPVCNGTDFVVTPRGVARRIVFLVDVGLSRETDTHEAKPVTKPRELARGTR